MLLSTARSSPQTVTGAVTNAITHEPIPGVTIRVFSANHARDISTDANGAFRAEAPQGCCVILLDKEGFADGTVRLPLQPGTHAAPLNLTMLPWPALSGRVINPERHAVGGSTVDAISLSWGAKWSTYCNARGYSDCKPASVGADGSFMLHVPPGICLAGHSGDAADFRRD